MTNSQINQLLLATANWEHVVCLSVHICGSQRDTKMPATSVHTYYIDVGRRRISKRIDCRARVGVGGGLLMILTASVQWDFYGPQKAACSI